jgi:UDP-glucose 4-epimerase
MGVPTRITHLPARHEVHDAHSSHERIQRVFGRRDTTPLDAGLAAMAAWVKQQGARSSTPFKDIEVTKNLPSSWQPKS